MRCENLAGCPFYNNKMSTDSGLGKLYKEKYCESNKINVHVYGCQNNRQRICAD